MPSSKTQLHDLAPPPRRGASPESGLTDEIDPTREIRTLIDQLQSTSRDARGQIRAVEKERDDLATQVAEARHQQQQLAARLSEVDKLARERDSAIRDAERQAKAAAESHAQLATLTRERAEFQRQRDDTLRQRDEILSQRDDAIRRRDDAARQREELGQRLNDAIRAAQDSGTRCGELGKQLISVRQARDTAQAQQLEFSKALAVTQDELDQAQETLRSQTDAAGFQAKIAELTAERTALLQRLATSPATDAALDEAQREMAALKESHDAAHAREDALSRDLAQLRADLDARAQLPAAEDPDEERSQILSREIIELRQQLEARTARTTELESQVHESARRLSELRGQIEFYEHDRDAARYAREEALTSLAAAQKQIEKIIRERDHIRQESNENALALETQLEALRVQIGTLEKGDSDGAAHNAKMRELASLLEAGEAERQDLGERLARQRTDSIDLAARLHNAQDEIKNLTATLGEARMAAKLGAANGSRAHVLKTLPAPTEPKRRTASATPKNAETIAAAEAGNVLDTQAAQDTINALRLHYHAFIKNSADITPFKQLHARVRSLAESARVGGAMAMHRVSAALTGLVHELYHFPEQITPGNLRTVCQTMDFLGTLLRMKDLQGVKDPAGSSVYVVEDDLDNSQCIALGLETAGLCVTCISDPVSALCELAATSCDLIVLDINLPNMSGFELCTEIRQFALHRTTPVIFLSGLTGSEHRAQSSLSGGNDFLTKPFILGELTLKALTLILKAELHVA